MIFHQELLGGYLRNGSPEWLLQCFSGHVNVHILKQGLVDILIKVCRHKMSTDLTELTDFSSIPNVSNVFVQVLVLGLKVSMSAGFQVSSFRISMFMLLSKKHRNTKARKLSHFQVSCFRISGFLTYEFPGFGVLLHLLPRVVGVWRRLVHHLKFGKVVK